MSKKPRILSSTGIYHITMRSVNQHIIFEESSDYQKFLFILSDCKTKYNVDLYAYCLMDNHIHLLLHADPDNLAPFFQSLGTRFVRWYNTKYVRSGHLFQGRYLSMPIENADYYLTALKYIHENPVKAMVCRYPSEYRWSSYNAFYGEKNPLINLSFSYEIAGSKDSLLQYFASSQDSSDETIFENDHKAVNHYLTGEQALNLFRSITGLSSISEVPNLTRKERNEYIRKLRESGLSIKQTARIMDVSVSTVKRL